MRADVVVVGSGIVGLSIAYQVARRSPLSVVVIEKGPGPGEGSTGASSAVLRQRYSYPELVRISRHGLDAFRNWSAFTGIAEPRAHFTHTGALWITGETREEVEADRQRMTDEGVAASVLDVDGLHEAFPALSACGVLFHPAEDEDHECEEKGAFAYEEDAGYFDPVSASQDLLDAVRREGVEVRFGTPVSGVRTEGGRVLGVDLADGTSVDAGIVINAAGPWVNQLNAMAGLELSWDLVPTRVQVFYRSYPQEVARPMPVVGDTVGGVYFRPESMDQQILVGSVRESDELEAIDDPDALDRSSDQDFQDRMIFGLHHRIPSLPYRGEVVGLVSLYTVNRNDVHPIVGPTEIEGFWAANGFSGHGFKLAPMVGSIVAQAITGEQASFDTDVPLSFLAVDREPKVMADKNVLA
jgi:glycine/D-amino acid oxidase-like deaminating enzyme